MVRNAPRRSDLLERWLDSAEEDLALARHLVEEKAPFRKAVLAHARAATEGFLRAFLIGHGIEEAAGSLSGMLDRVALVDSRLARALEPLAPLEGPDGGADAEPASVPSVNAKECQQALTLAEFTRESIRDALCDALCCPAL